MKGDTFPVLNWLLKKLQEELRMTPEVYHGQTDEHCDANDAKTREGESTTNYADLVTRIDRFLNDLSISTRDDGVRKGTQSKVRESLQVVQAALNDYG